MDGLAKIKEIQEHVCERKEGSKSISFSQLSQYVACPQRWYRAYVLNEAPYVPTIHTTFGTAFHETLQNWLDVRFNRPEEMGSLSVYEDLMNRLRTVYAKEKEALGQDFSTAKELASFYEDGVAILEYILARPDEFFPTEATYLVGCEIPLLYEIKEGFYFKGFIDCVTYDSKAGRWKILDFKTSGSGWNSAVKGDFHKTSQVLLYKYFVSQQFGIDMNDIDVEYFIVKRKIPADPQYKVQTRRVQQFVPANKAPSVKKAVQQVTDFIEGALTETGEYQQREYETLPDKKNCRWCLFKDTCKDAAS